MKAWLTAHHGKLQFGLRMTLPAFISYVAGEAIGLAQSYWAALSAVIVIQGSVGGWVRARINRFYGTVGGAIWGAAVAMLTAFKPDYRQRSWRSPQSESSKAGLQRRKPNMMLTRSDDNPPYEIKTSLTLIRHLARSEG